MTRIITIIAMLIVLLSIFTGCETNRTPAESNDATAIVTNEEVYDTGNEDHESNEYDEFYASMFRRENQYVFDVDDQFKYYELYVFIPYGVWEVIDSRQAQPFHAPYEIEPWPLEPLSNGSQLVITSDTFAIDGYDGTPDVLHFEYLGFRAINIYYFSRFRLLEKTEDWLKETLPYYTFTVGFFQDDYSKYYYTPRESMKDSPDREIYVVDHYTIMYTDFWYFYTLRRVDPALIEAGSIDD